MNKSIKHFFMVIKYVALVRGRTHTILLSRGFFFRSHYIGLCYTLQPNLLHHISGGEWENTAENTCYIRTYLPIHYVV